MEIAVLGGGHGAFAPVAELAEKGHAVRWWRREASRHAAVQRAGGLTLTDFRGTRRITNFSLGSDLREAVRDAELVVIPLPAMAHDSLARDLAGVLDSGQVVLLPPGTFGTFVFARALLLARPGVEVTFAESGTLPYLARKHGETSVVVSAYATRLPTGVLPLRNGTAAFSVLTRAYPCVESCGDALSAALMNAGPIIHPPLIVMNAGPLEHFPAWDIHNEGTQPAIRRVTDALDRERVTLRQKLGYCVPHFPLKDHYSQSGDEWMYGRSGHERLTESGDWREHIELLTHRYMVEDVAFGLSFLTSVAAWARSPMPLAAGLLAVGSAVVGRDLYAEGRTLENLGLAGMSRAEMTQMLAEGVHTSVSRG